MDERFTAGGEFNDAEVFNRAQALSNFSNDEELLEEMLSYFRESLETNLTRLKKSVDADDFAETTSAAHLIKGEAATLCVQRIRNAAFELEMSGRKEDGDSSRRFLLLLEAEIKHFISSCPG